MSQNDERKPYIYTPHTYTPFETSGESVDANTKAIAADTAYNNHTNGGFKFSQSDNQTAAIEQYKKWLNSDFTYDFNQDALYQQLKEQYTKQGEIAMRDAMGQASALTGGYGNSYAATVGNQAYQASLANLNNVIPELYQLAYNMHQDKGQNYLNQLNLYDKERAFEYGTWMDTANRLDSDRAYAQNVSDNLYNRDYNRWLEDRNYSQTEHHNSENMRYQDSRDAVSDAQWEKNYGLDERRVKLEEDKWDYQKNNASSNGNYYDDTDSPLGNDTITGKSSGYDKVAKNLQGYSTSKGQADYLADEMNKGNITESEALALLDEYGVVDLVDRSWEKIDDGGINWFGAGIDADAKVSDGNKTYTLAELRKELRKTMSNKEANDWIKELEKKLGI